MFMFNFKNPKNPYRKKGKNYRLSENSKLTGADFGYTRKLASQIYKIMQLIQNESCKNDTYTRFSKVLYKVVRNDQVHELGKLQLGYGNVAPLKGFRFFKKTNWHNFFMNKPTAELDIEKGAIRFAIPPIFVGEFNKFPKRMRKVIIKMHCIQISVGDENIIELNSSKELVMTGVDNINSRSVYFAVKDSVNVVVLCIATVRIWLHSLDSKEEFLSFDSKFMTAEIFDALVIHDGQLCHFEEEEFSDVKPPEFPNLDEEVDWV